MLNITWQYGAKANINGINVTVVKMSRIKESPNMLHCMHA